MAPLLIYSEHVPARARDALREATKTEAPRLRNELLRSAARILHAETGLPCEDVRELVGLPEEARCD